MKKFTREEIANILVANQSAEFDASGVTYYLHLTDDGAPQISADRADATFTASAAPADYGYTQEAWDAMESPEDIYDREVLTDPAFAAIVDILTEQVNAYLEGEDA